MTGRQREIKYIRLSHKIVSFARSRSEKWCESCHASMLAWKTAAVGCSVLEGFFWSLFHFLPERKTHSAQHWPSHCLHMADTTGRCRDSHVSGSLGFLTFLVHPQCLSYQEMQATCQSRKELSVHSLQKILRLFRKNSSIHWFLKNDFVSGKVWNSQSLKRNKGHTGEAGFAELLETSLWMFSAVKYPY